MNPYRLIRPLLFRLEPETAHRVSLQSLDLLEQCNLLRPPVISRVAANPREVMGIRFPNPVGLAAGLDKNGDHIRALARLGFGFLEIGTVTPRAQSGNPRPRMFRLPEYQAIINRMGFNNLGVEHLLERVKSSGYDGVLGINLGKNADTPMAQAADDYLKGLRLVYPYASYVTINISSPNTRNLRSLQDENSIAPLLSRLKSEQQVLHTRFGRYVPLVVKIAPDLEPEQTGMIAGQIFDHGIDGVIATNTTLSRAGVKDHPLAAESGGLSGAPLGARSSEVIRELYSALGDRIPIIAAGGIMTAAQARDRLEAGASLVQLYSGLIYAGPGLIAESVEATR